MRMVRVVLQIAVSSFGHSVRDSGSVTNAGYQNESNDSAAANSSRDNASNQSGNVHVGFDRSSSTHKEAPAFTKTTNGMQTKTSWTSSFSWPWPLILLCVLSCLLLVFILMVFCAIKNKHKQRKEIKGMETSQQSKALMLEKRLSAKAQIRLPVHIKLPIHASKKKAAAQTVAAASTNYEEQIAVLQQENCMTDQPFAHSYAAANAKHERDRQRESVGMCTHSSER